MQNAVQREQHLTQHDQLIGQADTLPRGSFQQVHDIYRPRYPEQVTDFLREQPLGSGVMRTCFFRAEKRNHLPVEGGQVRRLPTADPVAVPDHFTVYPLAAGIANVILDGVIAG